MRRAIPAVILSVILLASTVAVRASSIPIVQGTVSGIEVCAQFLPCGKAIFVAIFQGQIGGNTHAIGFVTVAVNHEPLPDQGKTAAILPGGVWQIQLLSGKTVAGVVTGGSLFNPLDDGTFVVDVNMALAPPGIGTAHFHGFLSHNTAIPAWGGQITQ